MGVWMIISNETAHPESDAGAIESNQSRAERSFDPETVDWARLVRPQTDRYDSEVALDWAHQAWGFIPSNAVGAHSWNQVQLQSPDSLGMDRMPGDIGHRVTCADFSNPVFDEADRLLDCWPEAKQQIAALLNTIYPVVAHQEDGSLTSICGSWTFGSVYSSCNSPQELLENVLHEMSHQKLRSLGCGFDRAITIVKNDPAEKFFSPVKPVPRPMSAILQTVYAFTHVMELHSRLGLGFKTMKTVIGKLCSEISENIKTDRPDFIAELLEWSDQNTRS